MIDWIVDSRSSFPAVADQGQRGTCLSMAITAVHAFQSQVAHSVEYLHWASGKYPGGRGDVGSAGSALLGDGQPPEAQWPYDADADEAAPSYGPPPAVVGPNVRAHVVLGAGIREIRPALESGRWPVLLLRVTDSFLSGTGVVLPDGPGTARHAVAAVGIARASGPHLPVGLADGEILVCVRNSWGESWGSGGHALVSETALRQCLEGVLTIEPA